MKTLKWRDLTDGRAAFHLARNGDGVWRECAAHGHDFTELFFVTSGNGLHRVNRHRMPLTAGDLVLMRPGDRHGLRAEKAARFSIINLAFHPDTLAFIRKRYFADDQGFWGGKGSLPCVVKLSKRQKEWLRGEFELLNTTAPTRLALERFLINLLSEVRPGGSPVPMSKAELPDWLSHACLKIRASGAPVKGPREFARLAGRSLEHVSRVMRALTGRTPTEFVNEARLDHAAAMLLNSGKEILDIAADCGFQGISHFYVCFQKQFGMSPRRYRLRHRRVFG